MGKNKFPLLPTHNRLLSIYEQLDPETFFKQPSPSHWSAALILKHLIIVEENFLQRFQYLLSKPDKKPVSFSVIIKRLLPLSLIVKNRIIKVSSPGMAHPGNLMPEETKEKLMQSWNSIFSGLKNIYDQHPANEWKSYVIYHPIFGEIDGLMAFDFLANHEARHTKQLLEVID